MRAVFPLGLILFLFLSCAGSAGPKKGEAVNALLVGEIPDDFVKSVVAADISVDGIPAMDDWDSSRLKEYDVIVIANEDLAFESAHDRDLRKFVSAGGGAVLLGGTGDCFFKEANYIGLVGARFSSFSGKTELLAVETEKVDHPVIADVGTIEIEGNRISHDALEENCTVLQTRDGKPWTWARKSGKGRVVYSAFSWDAGTGKNSGFQRLLRNAIRWAAAP